MNATGILTPIKETCEGLWGKAKDQYKSLTEKKVSVIGIATVSVLALTLVVGAATIFEKLHIREIVGTGAKLAVLAAAVLALVTLYQAFRTEMHLSNKKGSPESAIAAGKAAIKTGKGCLDRTGKENRLVWALEKRKAVAKTRNYKLYPALMGAARKGVDGVIELADDLIKFFK